MAGTTKLMTAGGGGVNLTPASSIASDVTVNLPVTGISGGTLICSDSSGNVGIRNSAPATSLQVSGTGTGSAGAAAGSGYAALMLTDTAATGNNGTTYINSVKPGTGWNSLNFGAQSYTWTINGNVTTSMELASDGGVRINTTTTAIDGTEILTVVNSAANGVASTFKNNTGGTATTCFWNADTSGNNVFINWFTDTSPPQSRGSINYNRGSGQVQYNATSDARLKENIVDAPSAISKIESIKVRSFDWKETGYHFEYGFIAQELIDVAPECVSPGDDGDTIETTWGVDASSLIPALVKMAQEQQALIESLTDRIAALEAK